MVADVPGQRDVVVDVAPLRLAELAVNASERNTALVCQLLLGLSEMDPHRWNLVLPSCPFSNLMIRAAVGMIRAEHADKASSRASAKTLMVGPIRLSGV